MTRSVLVLNALLFAAGNAWAEAESKRPPNVVIIFMDDMGYADIGPLF